MYEKFKSRVLKRMGVSPVIATLLLILIAVAAAVLVYLWVSGYVGTATRAQPEMEEKIKIEAVSVDASDGSVTCYVRNIGGVDAVIVNAYLEAGGIVQATTDIGSTKITPGGVTAIIASFGATQLTAGRTYTIKLVTQTGVEASYTFRVAGYV
jgi:flagellin-like protein